MIKDLDPAITLLRSHISGAVITTSDPLHDAARQTFADKANKPRLIIQCRHADDVAQAITFARQQQIAISVRSGGHGGAEISHNDGGLLIDLQPMHNVKLLDEASHIVRVESGATWGHVVKELSAYNLAITSGDTASVGVGGLTLGGGVGRMVRNRGLSVDALVAADVVDAEGRKLRASEQENPELFWAIRGGGGGFGIVTTFEFKAYPCQTVFGGHILYSAEKRRDILANWARYMRSAPEELNSTAVLLPGFGPNATPQVTIGVCYSGDDKRAAQEAIQPLRELGDTPFSDDTAQKSYVDVLGAGRDAGEYTVLVRNGFIKELTSDIVATIAEHFGIPGAPPLEIRSLGGAFSRIPSDATAFAHRHNEALIAMPSFTPPAIPNDKANAIADELWAPLRGYATGSYSNFLTDMRAHSIAQAYPPSVQGRLQKAKKQYDPDNIFHLNASVRPE